MPPHLDHIAILVRNTDEALKFYRDTFGLEYRLSEVIEDVGVRLTHLDLGNLDLQLVEPLTDDHPLAKQLDERGEHLHHLCLKVDDVPNEMATWPTRGFRSKNAQPHRGPQGRSAAFIDPSGTRGVQWEITADPPS